MVLFMKGTPEQPQCGFSRAAIQVLEIEGVPAEKFKSYNLLEDSELRSAIKEFSCVHLLIWTSPVLNFYGRDWPTIPQLYVGGEFVGGCDILLSSA